MAALSCCFESECMSDIGADPSISLWGSTEMTTSEDQSSKGGFLGRGCFPLHQLGDLGCVSVSSPSGIRAQAPATWWFKTFHRLTKPLLMSILLILNFFQ